MGSECLKEEPAKRLLYLDKVNQKPAHYLPPTDGLKSILYSFLGLSAILLILATASVIPFACMGQMEASDSPVQMIPISN